MFSLKELRGHFMKKKLLALFFTTFSVLSFKAFASDADSFVGDSFMVMTSKPHELTVLSHGMASFEQRLQMIERAQHSIDVEYFIYRIDKSAKILTQALLKKAREGVKVRLLLDYYVVKKDFSPFYAHELEQAGAEVKYFNTVSTLKLFSVQYRNHRKSIIIDGKEVITGGRNIGDEYFDLHDEYSFLDRDILIKGPLVKHIQETFDMTYNSKMSERVAREKMPVMSDIKYNMGGKEDTHGFNLDLRIWNEEVLKAKNFFYGPLDLKFESLLRSRGQIELERSYKGICNEMTFVSEYPSLGKDNRKNFRMVKYDIFERIKKAKESILMESPYYIVNNELGKNLADALERKVKVNVLTNSLYSSDAVLVYAAFDSIIPKWFKKGLNAYVFKGAKPESYEVVDEQYGKVRFGVHAKTLIFDNKDVVIGTFNIDPRSANYNSEMTITCENNVEFASAVQKDIDTRIEASINLDSKAKIKEAEFYQIKFGKMLHYYLYKGIPYIFGFLL